MTLTGMLWIPGALQDSWGVYTLYLELRLVLQCKYGNKGFHRWKCDMIITFKALGQTSLFWRHGIYHICHASDVVIIKLQKQSTQAEKQRVKLVCSDDKATKKGEDREGERDRRKHFQCGAKAAVV